jgi:hypothetical protein
VAKNKYLASENVAGEQGDKLDQSVYGVPGDLIQDNLEESEAIYQQDERRDQGQPSRRRKLGEIRFTDESNESDQRLEGCGTKM